MDNLMARDRAHGIFSFHSSHFTRRSSMVSDISFVICLPIQAYFYNWLVNGSATLITWYKKFFFQNVIRYIPFQCDG